MTSPIDTYINGIYSRFGYFGTWLPNAKINIGDIGIMKGKLFNRISSLDALKIPFTVRSGEQPISFNYALQSKLQHGSNISNSSKNSDLTSDVTIEFECEGSFVFQAEECLLDEIENKVALAKSIYDAYVNGFWNQDWCVIDSVVRSGCSTILISNSVNAKLELSATVNMPKIIDNLSNSKIGIYVRSQEGDVTRIIAEKGLSPLFKVSRLKLSLLEKLLSASVNKKTINFGGKKSSYGENENKQKISEDIWEKISPTRNP